MYRYKELQEKQLVDATINWLQNSFITTHIGTLNLKACSRSHDAAASVVEHFNQKFHSILYGATKWKKGKEHLQLPILFVLHEHEAYDPRSHVHIAFGRLNDLKTEKKLDDVFYQAAKNTKGVQFYWKKKDYWHAERKHESDIYNNAHYITKYWDIKGNERWNLHKKTRLSVHFDECKNSGDYLHYICRRLQQGSSLDTVLFQHMYNA